ncbi:hypothetical protein G7Y89_g10500 [Cudoniella acicularis]|uniref:non-specific serine/threonine protein kinase n=1 Tax=Cudoniella acicularis TaxID=354080 RepID=A0A8H4VYP8_9HELO|nr:hypothetical protein G7Y89_g10500 [Cudoniella acicularis]
MQRARKKFNSIAASHAGARCVRTLLDTFEIATAAGSHICLVHKPLGLRQSDFQALCPACKLPQDLLKLTLTHILLALDYLHTKCRLIHTDIQTKNILLNIEGETVLTNFEEAEINDPSPCKVDGDRIIYTSRELRVRGSTGHPVLCDFGEARIGDGEFNDDIQPYLYRAPKVILEIPWGKNVDIWNLGVIVWDLSQNTHLYNAQDANNELSSAQHLDEMTALLEPHRNHSSSEAEPWWSF